MNVMWFILIVYIIIMFGIGFYCRKKTNSVSDFVLGGRGIGPWMTAFAYGSSYFSAVVFIGYAGQFGWNYGVAATWIGIGNAVIGSLLSWMIMGNRTRIMTKQMGVSTIPDFFRKRYRSKRLQIVSAAIVFIFLIPYTASVYNGLSRLFEKAFNIDYSLCIIIMAVITAAYVILGGYKATAINDFVQGIIMLFGISAVVVCVVNYQGGIFEAFASLSKISDDTVQAGQLTSVLGPQPLNLIGVVILTSLGTWGLPQMVSKFYAIKDSSSVKRGAIISTIFALVVAGGSYFMGSFGRLYTSAEEITNPETGKLVFDEIVPKMLNSGAIPEALFGIVIVLVLAASMSTLSSLVLTSSSTLTIDLIKAYFVKDMSQKKQVFLMRILIIAFVGISVALALNKNTYISVMMSISWGALAGCFLGPLIYGLFSKKVTKVAVWFSFLFGILFTVIPAILFYFNFFPELTAAAKSLPLDLSSPVNWGAISMIFSLIITPFVSLFTKNLPKAQLEINELLKTCKKIRHEEKA